VGAGQDTKKGYCARRAGRRWRRYQDTIIRELIGVPHDIDTGECQTGNMAWSKVTKCYSKRLAPD